MRYILTLLLALGAFRADAAPCTIDAPCEIENGDYLLSLPPDWDGTSELPAILFYHGHNSSAVSTVRSAGLRESFVNRGYLLIAPNGVKRPGSGVRAWPAHRYDPDERDDVQFTRDVLADVVRRVPVDLDHISAAGFSAGGSMAWMAACILGPRFEAVISVAGAMRAPMDTAATPCRIRRALHVHGFADPQVPFEGRAIRDWHQGDVHETLALFRASNQCRSNPTQIRVAKWRSRVWQACENADLAYLEHDGGHGLPPGWTEIAHDWLVSGTLAHD